MDPCRRFHEYHWNHLVFVPGNDFPPTLDTDLLEEVEDATHLMDTDNMPLTTAYIAPSTEAALEALPFELPLPENLPFDGSPFEVVDLLDMNEKDGKEIRVKLKSVLNDDPLEGWISVEAEDATGSRLPTGIATPVKFSDQRTGHFQTNQSLESSMLQWMRMISGTQSRI